MEYMTITQVTKAFPVTTRMLRYYDQIGLLPSSRTGDYAYRMYDQAAIKRLRQILTLRKLRIPLREIGEIFHNPDHERLLTLFEETIGQLSGEIKALHTIRSILELFVEKLNQSANTYVDFSLLTNADVLQVIETLTPPKTFLKEEQTMEDLNKAAKTLGVLKNVRILHLPSCTVASSHYTGENPEDVSGDRLEDFIRSSNLVTIKPDFRVYGFNNPSPSTAEKVYGYEFMVTVPEDFSVSAPLEKKYFSGGLYAAHAIKMGDFQEWQLLSSWLENSPDYMYDNREPAGMGGCLEEHLNAFTVYSNERNSRSFIQLDLLIPIKPRK